MRSVRDTRLTLDEDGAATIWGLFWFMILVAFAGLAIDTTDGLRIRTMLQATADAAALAAAIDLPDAAEARATAVSYARDNMPPQVHGKVLDPRDVHVGRWDPDMRTLDKTPVKPDAVMVTTWRGHRNTNPLPVTFLRIIGLEAWNVRARAVAQKYVPGCLRDGLIARGVVDISSNNRFTKEICVHGQKGVHMQNHNAYDPGTIVSMPDLGMLVIPSGGMESNPGLRQALRENILDPRMVDHVDAIMQQMLDGDPAVLPDYIKIGGNGPRKRVVDERFDLSTARPGTVYHVDCKPNKNTQIPSGATVSEVVIISECEIRVGSKATLTDVVLGSRSGGTRRVDKANIGIAANVQLGKPDACAAGGGVQLFSNATIHTASTTKIDGVQMVSRGDIELGARDDGIDGISAQAGGDITLTSDNQFGLCDGGAPELFTAPYYRLVL